LFNADMLALASTRLGNGLTALAFAVITAGVLVVLSRLKRLPAHRAGLKHLQLLVFVLGIVVLLTIPVAMESFFVSGIQATCTTALEENERVELCDELER
jgi:hypothetical protein